MRSFILTLFTFITITISAQTATGYYNQGLEKFRSKQYTEAIALFDKAISLDPSLKDAYMTRGVIKADITNQLIEALSDYNKALEIDPGFAAVYYLRGLLYTRFDKKQEAIGEFKQAVRLNPVFQEAYYAMAFTEYELDDHKNSERDYSSAIAINPRSEKAYYGRALARTAIKDSVGALQDINKVIGLNDKNANAYCRRALLRYSTDREGAKADLNKALEIDPGNEFAKKSMTALMDLIKAEKDVVNIVKLKNIQEGMDFMAENGKKYTVITTATGLQYEILQQGTGAMPGSQDVVVTNCTGKLLNGKVFYDGKKAEFNVQGVVKGFAEGLQLMHVGGKYRLYIPYYLGFGLQASTNVPAGSLTIYDVELLSIKK